MESLTYFVSSRGILKSSTISNKIPVSSSPNIDLDLLDDFINNASIYICTDALNNFVTNFLPRIKGNFSLVTGDSDLPIDDHLINKSYISVLLSDERLINWHAQNLLTHHDKISAIPIGIDYHTMVTNPGTWGIKSISPIAQERALTEIFERAQSLEKRLFACYCNWQFALNRGDRSECLFKIDKNICLLEKTPTSRVSSWQRQSECMFVISPAGEGVDCHRTWEALLLGCIPIVKKSIFSKIFEDLPVIVINDWSEVNPEYLLESVNKMLSLKFNFQKVFTNYWAAVINSKPINNIPAMSINDFKQLICSKSY